MASLTETLTNDTKKAAVINDCCTLIDAEVADKGGISGMAIKAGYAAVKGIKPGFIKQAVEDLLPEFSKALDPLYQEAKTGGKPVAAHFTSNSSRVAGALLAITDTKVSHSKSGLIKGTYEKLRGTAVKNVESAVPRLGALIAKHAG
ncbi:hypothetical protein F0U62_18995 [Cystobacter fuscus]|uniref:DUF6918 family protein n=1 Tax=Cystobacter fuscus TaxID=43 RepID=UPI002B320F75|nr:hypothetical protein F0U62_18995 [Cystobacter fuscus]